MENPRGVVQTRNLHPYELARCLLNDCVQARPLPELLEDTDFFRRVSEADNFGLSFRGLLLYAQCGDSVERQCGLVVSGDEFVFGVGVYANSGRLAVHIVGPSGRDWPSAVSHFVRGALQRGASHVYVRHLVDGAENLLPASGFVDTNDQNAWCDGAPYEDETHNHRSLVLSDVIDLEGDLLRVKILANSDSRNSRVKFHAAFQRFENFLRRTGLEFRLETLVSPKQIRAAREIVDRHFRGLYETGKAIGSTALDYQLMLDHACVNDQRFTSTIALLSHPGGPSLPVGVFLGERLAVDNAGLYCTIMDRDPVLPTRFFQLSDVTGYSAICQYAYAAQFGLLMRSGCRRVDLGGSETIELDHFKRRMGCRVRRSVWRVATVDQLPALDAICQNASHFNLFRPQVD
ncbi:MAG: hypothetical protein U1A77_09855 [Pirellulales bacterium]